MNQKRTFILIISLSLVAILMLGIVIVGLDEESDVTYDETTVETTTPAPTTSAQQTTPKETTTVPETEPPLPYEGESFLIFGEKAPSLYLGDLSSSEEGDVFSKISYERNLLMKEQYGVTVSFVYSDDVYEDYMASIKGGATVPFDLINAELLKDGSRFIMRGVLENALTTGIDLEADFFDKDFNDYFTVNGNLQFFLGDANPSRYFAENVIFVSLESEMAERLYLLAYSDEQTYTLESLLTLLSEGGASLSLDESTLHSLMSQVPLFGFVNRNAFVNRDAYVDMYDKITSFDSAVGYGSAYVENKDVYIDCFGLGREGYFCIPLPDVSSEYSERGTISAEKLYAFALPLNLENREQTCELTEIFCRLSDGMYDEAIMMIAGGRSPMKKSTTYSFYDLLGWGDFSSHAYSAFVGKKNASTLKNTLEAPAKVSLQALKILFERYE